MKILNISNRLPITFSAEEGETFLKSSSGGLVSAIQSLKNEQNELHWIGVADFTKEVFETNKELYSGEFTLHPVYVEDIIYDDYYFGFSNSVLWPLFHYFPSFVDFKPSQFKSYMEANRIIGTEANKVYKDGDLIWIHDYHLLPLAAFIREKHPSAKIGFFLHIPFPSYELIRLLPKNCRDLLVKSLLSADLIGFHTYDYAQHFLTSVQMIEGIQHKHFDLLVKNRTVRVGVFPISIDFNKFNNALLNPIIDDERQNLRSFYQDKKIIFSVDRLDYTKGILYRLKGFAQFLSLYPKWKDNIVFILLAVPSRDAIGKYIERKQMIELLISEINGKYGNTKWTPIVYQYGSVGFEELNALYTCCDIALISPLRDGMNLVAKEFVASRRDLDGVLLLSDMTGAAKELTDALLFNPLDEDEIASKIEMGLEMGLDEQKERMVNLQNQVKKHNVFKWGANFLTCLEDICKKQTTPILLKDPNLSHLINTFHSGDKRLILLDYDGTLVDFKALPEQAKPSNELLCLLTELSRNQKNEIAIVSGRERSNLDEWFGDMPLTLIAEHGTYTKKIAWRSNISDPILWKEGVLKIMKTFAENCSGAFVEEKSHSVCWHYRNASQESGFAQSREVISILSDYLISTNANIIDGNKVIEVKPIQINKGSAVLQVFNSSQYDFCLAIGDDKTDEDLFEIMAQYTGITIKVGNSNSLAKYRLEKVKDVISFLELLKN